MLLLVHDHKFRRVKGEFYTTGGLSNETLQRYTNIDNDVCIFARIIEESDSSKQWSVIKEKVRIIGDETLSGNGLEEAIIQSDIVIIRLPSFLGNKACRLVRKYKKKYMIEMVGCAWDSLWNHGLKGKIVAPYCFFYNKIAVKKAPYVLYVTRDYLQSRYPTRGISIGCSDVVIDDLSSDILDIRIRKIQRQNNKIVIGTIGAVDVKYKGQEYVIEALKFLQKDGRFSYEYQIVGNGDNTYLRNKAKRCKVESQVKFLGGMPHEQIFEWLDSIDIYIQPSRQEGLPRALVEAQSRALPCVGSSIGGIPELLDKECIFSMRGNVSSKIAKKIHNLGREQSILYAEKNFKKACEYIRDVLDKKRENFYLAFYESALGKSDKEMSNE